MDANEAYLIINKVAFNTNLSEGAEGVEKILRNINNVKGIPLHDLSRKVAIPVPVIAAVRKELEKTGILTRDSGLMLTESGKSLLNSIGVSKGNNIVLNSGYNFPECFESIKSDLRQILNNRPDVNYALDQSHVDVTTLIMRAAYLFHHDAIEGRDVLFLGDDDLTSVAVFLLAQKLEAYPRSISIIDIDRRILDFIEATIDMNKIDCHLTHANLLEPLPSNMASQFDVFFTDPPYTIKGFKLFVSRGVESLKADTGKYGFINFPSRIPDDTVELFALMSQMGLAVQEVVNGFNSYIGAQIHASRSNMIRCVTSSATKPLTIDSSDPIYTASRK